MSGGRIVVYGGRGALGSKCVSHFKSKHFVRILCIKKKKQILKPVFAVGWID